MKTAEVLNTITKKQRDSIELYRHNYTVAVNDRYNSRLSWEGREIIAQKAKIYISAIVDSGVITEVGGRLLFTYITIPVTKEV